MEWEDSPFSDQDDIFFQKIDEDQDLAFALALQEEINEDALTVVSSAKPSGSTAPLGIVDEQWELIDPNPDIHALFLEFNAHFFYGKLQGVEVRWSPQMTLCAGVCSYEGRGGLCSVRLSLPLLKLRPRRDLVETLLHEMIHAYLFVTANNKDHDAHGPEFLSHMYRINKETGTKITVYHSFHDEVDYLRKHWWQCDGPCKERRPFFGKVKRAKNRPPGPNDRWWADHQSKCGGTFKKIKEPEDFKKKNPKRKLTEGSKIPNNSADIKSFFHPHPSTSNVQDLSNKKKKEAVDIHTIKSIFEKEDNLVAVHSPHSSLPVNPPQSKKIPVPFSGQGFMLGSSSSKPPMSLLSKVRKEIGYSNPKNTSLQSSKKFNNKKPNDTKNSSVNGKEIGYSNSQTVQRNTSSQSINVMASSSKKSQNTKNSVIKKETSNCLGDFQSSSNASGKKLSQSSIDKFVISPTRVQEKGNSPGLNATVRKDDKDGVDTVMCPVCFSLVPNNMINAHLDCCLNKFPEM